MSESNSKRRATGISNLMFAEVNVAGLAKLFGRTWALAGVDLHLRTGTVTGLEGPNGSGKSTLLEILAQMSRPTRGSVRYGTSSTPPNRAWLCRHIGTVGHAAMLYPELHGRENLLLYARLFDITQPETSVQTWIERFSMTAFADQPVSSYSRGQLQRAALVRGFLHEPRLLLLDEPTHGLDHQGVEALCQAIVDQRQNGAIIVLITHDQGLAERLCDRRVRLERGRIIKAA